MDGGAVVQVGADIDLIDADLRPEIAEACGALSGKTPGGGLGVAAPEQDHIAVLGHILNNVIGWVVHALNALAPDMLRAPVPAFPAVRVPDLLGKTAHHFKESAGMTVRCVDCLALAVPVTLYQYRQRSVLLVYPLDLGGENIGSLFPGNPLVLAFTTVLWVPFSVGVPVDPFQGVLDAVGGEGAFFIGQRERSGYGFE